MAAAEETLEQRVFGIFETTQEVLNEAKRIFPDRKNHSERELSKAIGQLGSEQLVLLVKGVLMPLEEADGIDNVRARDAIQSWRREEATIKVASLAEQLYLERQSEEVASLIGDNTVTATILDGVTGRPIASLPEEGYKPPAGNSVTGTLDHASVSADGGRLLLKPLSEEPNAPSLWNVQPMDFRGNPLVDLSIEAAA